MSRIGIYSVGPTELSKPPSMRQYEERGVYDIADHVWTDSTDSRITCVLPAEAGQEYTLQEIQEALESTTLHVYLENEVPGEVIRSSAGTHSLYSASD